MNTMPYFERLAQMLALFDDELMAALLATIQRELNARGKSDAGCYIGRACNCLVPSPLAVGSSSGS